MEEKEEESLQRTEVQEEEGKQEPVMRWKAEEDTERTKEEGDEARHPQQREVEKNANENETKTMNVIVESDGRWVEAMKQEGRHELSFCSSDFGPEKGKAEKEEVERKAAVSAFQRLLLPGG